MIVIEKGDALLLFQQHQHGLISGEMAKHFEEHILSNGMTRSDVELAIRNHDYAWMELDQQPLWNEVEKRPYSFVDFPLEEKLRAYRNGIDYVQQQSEYAGLLCSMHYISFFSKDSSNSSINQFISWEIDRGNRIKAKLKYDFDEKTISYHLQLLQFCDDLSLYLCLNEPGTPKEREFPWFKNGFRQRFDFAENGMIAEWVDQAKVCVHPYPFQGSFTVEIPYKQLDINEVDKFWVQKIYNSASIQYRKVTIVEH